MSGDTNDLRTIVARAIYCAEYEDDFPDNPRHITHALEMQKADAAIAAATPIIRERVIEELIAEASAYREDDTNPFQWHHSGTLWEYDDYLNEIVADWLRSRKEQPNE